MERLVEVCEEVTNAYKKHKFAYSDAEEEVFAGLKKFSRCVDKLSGDEEIFSRSCEKFWQENKEYFEPPKRATWYKHGIKLQLYSDEGKVVKGPCINMTHLYNMASHVDSLKSKNLLLQDQQDTLCSRLQKEFFKVISSYVSEFKNSSAVANRPTGAVPFDLSKIGDILDKVLDSGIIPGSEKVDKSEISRVIGTFVKDPKVGEIVQSVTQMMTTEGGAPAVNAEDVTNVISSLVPKSS